jgi:hypothetical protein
MARNWNARSAPKPTRGNRRDGAMRRNEERKVLKTQIFESAT